MCLIVTPNNLVNTTENISADRGQQFFAKKTEPDLALCESGVYIVRVESVLY